MWCLARHSGRREEANPDSRDSGRGRSDRPGMTSKPRDDVAVTTMIARRKAAASSPHLLFCSLVTV